MFQSPDTALFFRAGWRESLFSLIANCAQLVASKAVPEADSSPSGVGRDHSYRQTFLGQPRAKWDENRRGK